MSANPNPGTHKPVPRLQNFDHRDPVGQALAQRILHRHGHGIARLSRTDEVDVSLAVQIPTAISNPQQISLTL